jgi:hypothetical protein
VADPRFEQHDVGLSWLPDPGEVMQRASHAAVLGGRVWVIDPVDVGGLDDRIRAAGEPAAVVQLLDRHNRDCAEVAGRLGVPHHRLPFDGVEAAPFEAVPVVRNRLWNEVALWAPEERALIVAEAVGTAPYFRAGDEQVGIHPMLRLTPPRRLGGYDPEHLLSGHGTGMHGPGTAAALRHGLDGARRRIPQALVSIVRPRSS